MARGHSNSNETDSYPCNYINVCLVFPLSSTAKTVRLIKVHNVIWFYQL